MPTAPTSWRGGSESPTSSGAPAPAPPSSRRRSCARAARGCSGLSPNTGPRSSRSPASPPTATPSASAPRPWADSRTRSTAPPAGPARRSGGSPTGAGSPPTRPSRPSPPPTPHRPPRPASSPKPRSRGRQVGEEDPSGVEPLHVLELHPDGSPVAEHVDVPLAPDERVQVDLVLVDQALLGEGVGELAAPVREQVAVGLALQLRDRVIEISLEQGRVPLEVAGQGVGPHVLRQGVDHV